MMMKNKITLFTIIIIGITFIFFWQMSGESKHKQTTIDPALMPVKQALLDLQQELEFKQLSKDEQREKIITILERIPDSHKRIKHQYQVAMSGLPKISFYGRVIDQYGQPVKKALIVYIGVNAYLSAGGGQGAVYTDEDGYFEIDTTGASIQLRGVGHPEIDGVLFETPEGRPSIVTSLNSSDIKGTNFNYNNYSEKENAYIINAWRLGKYEGAIGSNIIGHYDGNGKYYTLLFDQSVYDNRRNDGKTDGHIFISCTREHMEKLHDHGDWSVSIEPVNGGIQESNDVYTNIAPIAGYQSSINITMRPVDKGYLHELKKQYYFKSNNGKEYGSFSIEIKPFRLYKKHACMISIYYKINPTGSRNLELKRSNTSQQQLPSPQKLASNL